VTKCILALSLRRWLQAGSYRVTDLLSQVSLPVVVAAGTQDRVLPSQDEAARLKKRQGLVTRCMIEYANCAGGRVNRDRKKTQALGHSHAECAGHARARSQEEASRSHFVGG
jgi:hypothetical protein